jgi:general secretion pathway protein I
MRKGEAGFTLLEMLVALAVFGIAALALLKLDGFAVGTAADLAEQQAAALVADNEAALVLSDPAAPMLGAVTRVVANGGRSFTVQQEASATADRRLVRVDLRVTALGGAGRARTTLIKRVA